MERNISPAAILCIVLVSLAAVIGLGYGAFAITKGSANDGTQEVATQTSAASKSWKDTYDAKDVTGAQVQSLVKEAESKGIAVFINTRGMSQGTINSTAEVPVLKHNGKYYMNYGTVFDYEDDSYKKTSGEISMSGNSGLLGVRDGSSLKVDYNPKLQDGKLVRHEDYTGLYSNGAVNYIDTHAKFRSNLIYGNDGEVVGVILSQVNRPGASLPLSSGGGFVNGSSGMGGTSGSYVPSHSNSGNIPLTGGGSTGGSSSGSSSYAPSTGGANAPGTSTKPSAPAPETASGEFVITFDTRGGNVIDYQKVSSGAKVTKPDAPVRTNYGFAGWYTDESCTKKFNFSTSVSKNITLYARWFMWGDVDNNGEVNANDENNIFDYTSMDLESLNFYLAAFTTSPLDSGTISARDVGGIAMMRNGQQPVMPVSTATSGYEFDLEKGKYYTKSGDEKSLPVAEERFKIVIGDNRYKFVVRAGATWSDAMSKAPGLWSDSGNMKSTNEGYLLLDGQIVKASDKVVKGGNYTIGQPTPSGNVIPEGAVYYCGVKTEHLGDYSGATATYTAGQSFPDVVSEYDVYVYGDYEYRYKMVYNYNNWDWHNTDGWSVRAIDNSKSQYGSIIETINGVNVTDMVYTFAYCTSLKKSPNPPSTVKNMGFAYQGCSALEVAPVLPNGVDNLEITFEGCTSLKEAPVIPNSVSNLDCTFCGCTSLIKVPNIPNGVSNMASTFDGCTSLTTVPAIPSSVTRVDYLFYNCESLTGTIEINATRLNNIYVYDGAFEGTKLSIELTGSCEKLYELTETSPLGNVTVKGSEPDYSTMFLTDGNGTILGVSETYKNSLRPGDTVVIPSKIGNETITALADCAFVDLDGLIEAINSGAFGSLETEEEIFAALAQYVAFVDVNLELPGTITSVGEWSLMGIYRRITLGEGFDCSTSMLNQGIGLLGSVEELYFPASATNIHHYLLAGSTESMDSFEVSKGYYVSDNNPNYTSHKGVLYNKDMTVLIKVPAEMESYEIPEGVKEIRGRYPFARVSNCTITLPTTLEYIDFDLDGMSSSNITYKFRGTIDEFAVLNVKLNLYFYGMDVECSDGFYYG